MDWKQARLGAVAGDTQKTQVDVRYRLLGSLAEFAFEVRGSELRVNPDFPKTKSTHGLWDFDVVEVFLQPDPAKKTYYEFQVSPLNQFFELEIFEPRKKVNAAFVSCFEHSACISNDRNAPFWSASLKIDLKTLGGQTDPKRLRWGAFACLASPESRQYFALNWPPQSKPDFHKPEFFSKFCR